MITQTLTLISSRLLGINDTWSGFIYLHSLSLAFAWFKCALNLDFISTLGLRFTLFPGYTFMSGFALSTDRNRLRYRGPIDPEVIWHIFDLPSRTLITPMQFNSSADRFRRRSVFSRSPDPNGNDSAKFLEFAVENLLLFHSGVKNIKITELRRVISDQLERFFSLDGTVSSRCALISWTHWTV